MCIWNVEKYCRFETHMTFKVESRLETLRIWLPITLIWTVNNARSLIVRIVNADWTNKYRLVLELDTVCMYVKWNSVASVTIIHEAYEMVAC